jgi:hypothetical protein
MNNQDTRAARMPIAHVQFGRGRDMAVTIYGETEAELGKPQVELSGALLRLQQLTPAKADELAAALTLAASHARGETMPPTALDLLIESRKHFDR